MKGRFLRSLLFFLRAGPWLVAFLALLLPACFWIPPPDITCALCPCGDPNEGWVCSHADPAKGRCVREGQESQMAIICKLPAESTSEVSKEAVAEGERPATEPFSDTERRPEDGSPSEEVAAEQRPEVAPDTCQTNCPRITSVEGEGSLRAPTLPPGVTLQDPRLATQRFTTHWLVSGQNLDAVTSWHLAKKDRPNDTTLLASERRTTMFRLTLPTTLTTGFFLLLGFVAQTPVVSAEVFVLQGEGFDADTLAYIQRLKSRLTVDAATNDVTLKAPSVRVEAASVRLEAGTAALSLSSTPAKLTAEAPVLELKAGAASVSLDATSRTLLCQGANVQIQNGSGKTDQLNGFGNLILGYNKANSSPPLPDTEKPNYRQGSHNLVIGDQHTYYNYGGFLAGSSNASLAASSSVSGGQFNVASEAHASVSGGESNTASGAHSSVAGGSSNTASGAHSSVAGGSSNTASGAHSSVAGGKSNNAGQAGGQPVPAGPHTHVCGGSGKTVTSAFGISCGP